MASGYPSLERLKHKVRLLVVSANVPTPDQASGDLRFFSLLSALAGRYHVSFCAYGATGQKTRLGDGIYRKYANRVKDLGVELVTSDPIAAVHAADYDIVLFEFYFSAEHYLGKLRRRLPKALMVIDTVDVHFNRLESKARLTGDLQDRREAEEVKAAELHNYRAADALIVVSTDEKVVLSKNAIDVPQYTIPNFHVVPALDSRKSCGTAPELLFIGSFAHAPNVDAIVFFCRDVFPMVQQKLPLARLTIVGGHAPPEVRALASDSITVMGYVEDLAPVFARCHVSVAPLRYGGGVKGKVGEAMAEGLPLVTTTVGAEGLNVTDGIEMLIADEPSQFASNIVKLANDPALYARVRLAAWLHVENSMSVEKVGAQALAVFEKIGRLTARQLPVTLRAAHAVSKWISQNIAWRFKQS